MPDDEYEIFLSPDEASDHLSRRGLPYSPKTLAKLRCVGGGPIFRRFGRNIKYTPRRLDEFAQSKLSGEQLSTSQAAPLPQAAPAPRSPGRPRKVVDNGSGAPPRVPIAAAPSGK